MPFFSDEEGLFPLCARLFVQCARSPVVFGVDVAFAYPSIDHRLDGECHSSCKRDLHLVVVMQNLRRLMKADSRSVPDELIDDGASMLCGIIFDHIADLTEQ